MHYGGHIFLLNHPFHFPAQLVRVFYPGRPSEQAVGHRCHPPPPPPPPPTYHTCLHSYRTEGFSIATARRFALDGELICTLVCVFAAIQSAQGTNTVWAIKPKKASTNKARLHFTGMREILTRSSFASSTIWNTLFPQASKVVCYAHVKTTARQPPIRRLISNI